MIQLDERAVINRIPLHVSGQTIYAAVNSFPKSGKGGRRDDS